MDCDYKGKKVDDLPTPALVIYKHRAAKNCARMLEAAKAHGVQLRPHFKTTKCVEAAVMQTGGTKRAMVVSTLPEGELLRDHGFDDIFYGVPLAPNKIDRCRSLAESLESFSLFVDNQQIVQLLKTSTSPASKRWSLVVKVCCENGRAGVPFDSPELVCLVKEIVNSETLEFRGLYAHCGDSYYAQGIAEVQKVADRTTDQLLKAVESLKSEGIECKVYGIGSTPTCSQPTPAMGKLTEWHPGNYVLFDHMQLQFGSCSSDDIGCFVITQVVGRYPDASRNFLLVDCGFTALSRHGGGNCCGRLPEDSGFGMVVGHPELKLHAMSQEHGEIRRKDGGSFDFASFPLGSRLRIVPDHSCATCAMHPLFYVADQSDVIIEQWTPARGW